MQEIHFMKIINNPNVIKLIDFIETYQNYYIIMELCESDLNKILQCNKIINEGHAVQYLF